MAHLLTLVKALQAPTAQLLTNHANLQLVILITVILVW